MPALRDARHRDASGVREFVEEYTLADGRRIYLLGEGRLVNLAAAEGHPAAGDGHVVREPGAGGGVRGEEPRLTLEKTGLPVPEEIDNEIARLKLRAMGVEIDKLTAEQDKYLHSWQQGT